MGALVTPEQDDDGPEASARARAQTPADGGVVGSAFVNAVRSTVWDSVSAVRELAVQLAEGVRREPAAGP